MTRDRKTVLLLGDMFALVASFLIMIAIRFGTTRTDAFFIQMKLFGILFILWLIIFFIFDLYNLRRVNPTPRSIGLLGLAIAVATLTSGILFYLFPNTGITPKTNLAIVAVTAFILLVGWRRFFYKLLISRFIQKIAVIGDGPVVDHLLEDLARNQHIGRVVSIQKEYAHIAEIPEINILIAHNTDLKTLLEISKEKNCEVFSLFEAYEELFGKIPLSLMNEEKALAILAKQHQMQYRAVERFFEIVIAIIVLIITSPFLIVAIAAIIIEDHGPVIYRQLRVGKNGILFSVYKLRSMIVNAEKNGAQWADKRDSRTTRTGRILRTLHIDEIPQMINVLTGDISFIGPRPERPELVATLEKEIPYYFLRHTVKPGFTGWAQIKFRYARTILDSQEKFEYDLYYLANKNPLFDLGIFVKTIQIIFTH